MLWASLRPHGCLPDYASCVPTFVYFYHLLAMANPFGYASSDSSEASEDERALPTLPAQAATLSHPPASPQARSSVDSQEEDALADLLAMSAGSSSDEEEQAASAAPTTVHSQTSAAVSSAFSVPLLPSRPPPDAAYSAGRKRARPVSLEQQEQHIQQATEQAPHGAAAAAAAAAGSSSGGVDYTDRAQLAAVETEVYKLRAAELKAQVLAKAVKPASKPGRHVGQPDEDNEPDTAFSLLTTAEYVPPAVDSSSASQHIAAKSKELQAAKSMIIQAAAAGTTEQAHGGDTSGSDGELALELLDWQQ